MSVEEVARYLGGEEWLELGKDEEYRDGRYPYLNAIGIGGDNEIRDARRAYDNEGYPTGWWLRTPGVMQTAATDVFHNGFINVLGSYVNQARYAHREGVYSSGLRPALWINLETYVLYG